MPARLKWPFLVIFFSCVLDGVPPASADDSVATNSIRKLSPISFEIARIDHDRIVTLAEQALTLKPPVITDQVATNSAGGLHDFYSQADYAWPNPAKPTGLPYINRDGESNPNTFTYHRMAMRQMKDAVAALAAAYALTGEDKYVTKAATFLRVFFLDAKTRMNPNLQYAQAVLGVSTGREYGVIDTLHLVELPMAVSFLEKSAAFPAEVDRGIKKWLADYSEWITTSTNGVKEMHNANNHSIACYLQLASFAKFTGDEKLLESCRQRFKEVLFPRQMTNNGSFPSELARTKPYGYSIFQADNLAALCVLLSTPNDDLWKFTLPDGRTPRNAVDFIYPYLAHKNQWLADGYRKDVMHWENWPVRQPCLIFAYAEFGDEKYFDLWKKLNADPANLEIRRNMAITQPLLWVASPNEIPLLRKREPKSATSETAIWLCAPARNFTESSPMGNGRLGAMMFGGIDDERIVLNESSVWSGSRQDADRPDAYKALPEIRRLLVEGKNVEGEALVNANFTCKGPGSADGQYGCYQVLGNLHLTFQTDDTNAPVTNYRRELNLKEAITRMQFTRGGGGFQREMFVSAPDEVMVLRLRTDRPGKISFTANLDRPERFATVADGKHGLLMSGQLDNGMDGKGLRYVTRVRVMNRGGKIFVRGNTIEVSKANEAVLLIAAATDYQGFSGRQTKDPAAATLQDLDRAARKSFEAMQQAHIADYQKFFKRVSLQLGPDNPAVTLKPTPERLQAFKNGTADPALSALYFNFGRYLLISCSRPGGLPANLQGIWAEETNTPWTGDWHLDVNVEMNYWPAEICNLSELHEPLFDLIGSLQVPGAKTAKAYYGARGWVAHVITNPWGFTSPGEEASWGAANSGSAWLCQHLWDHWLFTHDRKFLNWAYPILKGSARFYADMLMEEPKHHWLVIAPANSPENHFQMADGRQAAICMGPTTLQQLVRYLFTACIESSKILGTDHDLRNELMEKRAKLAPTQIGSDGRIMEWLEDYAEPEPHHRHVSHLWGLYPGGEISRAITPELAAAARKSLEGRGDDGVGWSLAYKVALWARLWDGERAYALVRKALSPTTDLGIRYDGGGGVYPNLFDACPPFQIDGNFGVTAAIAEMLLQSRPGQIELLPALPAEWPEGSVKGLRARGGLEVDMAWKNGRLTNVVLRSDENGTCRLSYGGKAAEVKIKKRGRLVLNGELE